MFPATFRDRISALILSLVQLLRRSSRSSQKVNSILLVSPGRRPAKTRIMRFDNRRAVRGCESIWAQASLDKRIEHHGNSKADLRSTSAKAKGGASCVY